MTRDDWKRIKTIAAAALDLPVHEQDAFIAAECGDDAGLAAEVSSLVAAAAGAEALYETPSLLIAGATAALESLASYEAPRVGDVIGPYRLVRSLGGSGASAGYLAVRDDARSDARVVLKVLKRGMGADGVIRRYRRERRTLDAIAHPYLARVTDAGVTADGLPYFVSDYVEGSPIDVHCRFRQLTTGDRVRLFAIVCEAVAHAHELDLVHTNLKPANILVTAEGRPMIVDLGLAAALTPAAAGREVDETFRGGAAALLPYASPEQLRHGVVTPASDVYSLGVVLYELVAGRRPGMGGDGGLADDRDGAWLRAPLPPSAAAPPTARPAITPELDAIVLRALRPEPDCRYATAGAMARDLRRLIEGQPVEACTGRLSYALGRAIRRHRLRFVGAALTAAMMGAAAIAGAWWSEPTEAARSRGGASLAVLPFVMGENDDDTAYLASGFARGLAESVSMLPGMRVLAPGASAAPFRGDVRVLAQQLDVASLLLGELRHSGGRIVVVLRLVDGQTGRRFWARRFTGRLDGLVRLRDDMRAGVLDGLTASDTPSVRLPVRDTVDAHAYVRYLRASHVKRSRSELACERAAEEYRDALARDPQYARAYAGLAECYNLLAIAGVLHPAVAGGEVKAAAGRAAALDGTLADAHAALAVAQWLYERAPDAAASGFERALALDPGSASVSAWYARYLAWSGRMDDARAAAARARSLDRLSPGIAADAAELAYWARDYDRAARELKEIVADHPAFARARRLLALVELQGGRVAEAVRQAEQAEQLDGGAPPTLSVLAYVYGKAGRREDAIRALATLSARARTRYIAPAALALAHLGSGARDLALDHLERVLTDGSDAMLPLGLFPPFDELRGNARFESLLARTSVAGAIVD